MISLTEGTRPDDTTSPSIASAGVDMTPYAAIRRSLTLRRAIAKRLRQHPEAAIETAETNLERKREQHPHARSLSDEWGRILARPVESIVETMVDPSTHARDLRNVTPFAGVLADAERTAVYERVAEAERSR